jgi:hypothetical protein
MVWSFGCAGGYSVVAPGWSVGGGIVSGAGSAGWSIGRVVSVSPVSLVFEQAAPSNSAAAQRQIIARIVVSLLTWKAAKPGLPAESAAGGR